MYKINNLVKSIWLNSKILKKSKVWRKKNKIIIFKNILLQELPHTHRINISDK